MQPNHVGRAVRHQDRGRPRLERERNLGAHQHQRRPAHVAPRLQRFGEEHHRRDADAAADEQRARTAGRGHEAFPDRSHDRNRCALAAASTAPRGRGPRSCRGCLSSRPSRSARMIDSGRRIGSSGSQVRCAKLPGVAAAAHFGARRRMTYCCPGYCRVSSSSASSTKIVPRCERSPSGPPSRLRRCAPARCATMVGARPWRTATRLHLAGGITDCGPSATSLAISTPRFIGARCITIGIGLREAQVRARDAPLAVERVRIHELASASSRAVSAAPSPRLRPGPRLPVVVWRRAPATRPRRASGSPDSPA